MNFHGFRFVPSTKSSIFCGCTGRWVSQLINFIETSRSQFYRFTKFEIVIFHFCKISVKLLNCSYNKATAWLYLNMLLSFGIIMVFSSRNLCIIFFLFCNSVNYSFLSLEYRLYVPLGFINTLVAIMKYCSRQIASCFFLLLKC